MKKRTIFKNISILFILAIFMSSCVGGLPAPESGDDTLLIVITGKNLQGGVNDIFSYYEIKTDKTDNRIVITPKKKYCMVPNLPSGDYINLTILERFYTSHSVDTPNTGQPTPVRIPFQMKPGYITIFPLKFVYNIKIVSSGYTYYWDVKPVTEQEIIEALTELSEKEGFSEWKNDLGL